MKDLKILEKLSENKCIDIAITRFKEGARFIVIPMSEEFRLTKSELRELIEELSHIESKM